MFPAKEVQVEASEEKNRVVHVMLVFDGDFSDCVVLHDAVIVCAAQGVEESVREREKGHQFDIWVVLGCIRYDMVDVVTALPPA